MKLEAGLHDVADFSPITPGVYELVIKEPPEIIPEVYDETDIGGKMYTINVQCEIASGPEAGKKVWRRITNKSKATRYFMKRFLEGIGITIGSDGSFITENMLGRKFKAAIYDRQYKDADGNEKKASDIDLESVQPL